MACDALITEGWELAQRYYRANCRRIRRPFDREVYWDGVVDGLLKALDHYDGRIPFRPYCWLVMRTECRHKYRWIARFKRNAVDECPQDRDIPFADRGADVVDGRDLWDRLLPTLPNDRRAMLERWLRDETESAIARTDGLSRQVVSYRILSTLDRLREAA